MRGRFGWAQAGCAILGLLALIGALAYTGGAGSPTSRAATAAPPGLAKIDHIIFIVKENHSFDNYFGRFPGADGADDRPHLHGHEPSRSRRRPIRCTPISRMAPRTRPRPSTAGGWTASTSCPAR